MSSDPEILFWRAGSVGHVKFNRPQSLNALNFDMVAQMQGVLDDWAVDPKVSIVLLQGEGERAFCAGGDIRRLAESSRNEGLDYCRRFFSSEFRLNRSVFRYPKPYISVLDGITMGGGVGLSVHGQYRIATERTLFAMPETGIGYFPDVGGSYFLPRCPGSIGMYLGLSGARLKVGDSLAAGIATHYVPSSRVNELIEAFEKINPGPDASFKIDEILSEVGDTAESETLLRCRPVIDQCFSGDSLEQVLDALDACSDEWSKVTASAISKKSPTSLKVTFRQLREGGALDFEACMVMELRLALRFMEDHDFYEGVRAVVIEKDNQPKWQPNSISEVTNETVQRYFRPLAGGDLIFN